ncbi:MAG: Cof-type HAD-IIB family hydrolase [Blautia sp.]
MGIKCIALDLDRTTLSGKGKLSEENRKAIEKAIEHGIEVVVASGRALHSLPQDILDIHGIRYAITSNGAAVYEIHSGKCLRQYKMTEESVKLIMKLTDSLSVTYEVFIDGEAYAGEEYIGDPVRFGATEKAIPYIRNTRQPVRDIQKFIFENQQVLDSMDIITSSQELKEELWITLKKTVKDVYITSSVRQLLEISYKKSGKHTGAAFILEHLGLKKEQLAAFGDGDNDADLLAYAQAGFAVANGTEACRNAADYLVPSHEENGVAQGIERILRDFT